MKKRFVHSNLVIDGTQERPRGVKVSLKLKLSFLIYAKTSKGVNSTIWRPYEVFPRLGVYFLKV